MLTIEEIKMFIDEDAASMKKHFARIGERYFDGDHDIKSYRMFYFNNDGQLVEDTSRANVRITHPFFKELTEQGTQYTLSGTDGFVFSDIPELQSELDSRFNNNDDFIDELSETLTDCQTKGFAYMYAMKDSTDKLKFTCADSIGVVEIEARFAEDKKDHVIYWYVDRVDKEGHRIKKIMDWDDEQVVYYVQTDEGEIQIDDKAKVNPRPHILYQVDGDDNTYIDSLGFLPFFRLDNNKKQFSNLKAVKGARHYIFADKANGLKAAGWYWFNADGTMFLEGIREENGTKYYYKDGVKNYAGLIEISGEYYYVKSDCSVVCDRSYYVTKSNGLMPSATYTFDADGKMVIKNGIYREKLGDGNEYLFYYVNNVRQVNTGLVQLDDGSYIYVRSGANLAVGSYYVSKTNNLLPKGTYTFGEDGKMVVNP